MPRPYSDDLRAKLLEAYAAGRGSLEELADQFGVRHGYAKKIRGQQLKTARLERPPQLRYGPKGLLTAEIKQYLRAAVAGQPDVTLAELKGQLQKGCRVQISQSRLWYWLRGLGLRHKTLCASRNRTALKTCGCGTHGGSWSARSTPPAWCFSMKAARPRT